MGPFTLIAASVLPGILRHFSGGGDQASRGSLDQAVTAVVQAVTKETDPDAARKKIAADPNTEAELRVRLSELAASLQDAGQDSANSAQYAQLRAMEQAHSAQVDSLTQKLQESNDAHARQISALQDQVSDSASANTALSSITSPKNPSEWGPPLISLTVIFGFFAVLAFIMSDRFDPSADTSKLQIINIVIGALTAGFASVLHFWVGSSLGSKNKDLANFSLQNLQTLQAGRQNAAMPTGPSAPPTAASAAPAPTALQAPPAAAAPSAQTPIAQTAALSSPPAPPLAGAPAATSAAATALTPASAGPPSMPGAATADANTKANAFETCVHFAIQNEGGFVDNPEDPGGATNMGITIGTLRAWRGEPVTVDDVRNLTEAEAERIYRANYWNPLKCDELPLGVDMVVFDFGVNAGIRRSAMTLQEVVGVEADGIIGPKTLAAVFKKVPSDVVVQFGQARLRYYEQLKEWPEFGKGWADRESRSQAEAHTLMSSDAA